jgi:hypothetical protein
MSVKKYCNAICLNKNGSTSIFQINSKILLDEIKISDIDDKYKLSIGYDNLERECDYEYLDTVVSFFAWTDGKAGTENKHELPDPIDKELYFGNIFVFRTKNSKLIDFSKAEYDKFSDETMGGMIDLGKEDDNDDEDDEDEDDDNTDLDGFVVNSSEEISMNSNPTSSSDEYVPSSDEEDDDDE